MKNIRTRVAAATTIIGLGGLTGLALSAGSQKSAPVAAKPLIRTKVIRRTIHVVKHVKPKHPVGAGAAGGAVAYAGAGRTGSLPSYAASSAPVTTHSSGASAAAAPTYGSAAPVVTHTSGSHTVSGGGHSSPVVTHTSGSHAGGGGHVVTHSSGSGGERGDRGGD